MIHTAYRTPYLLSTLQPHTCAFADGFHFADVYSKDGDAKGSMKLDLNILCVRLLVVHK